MAEAFAVIAAIDNIIGLVEFGLQVTSRIGDYGRRTTELPETLENVNLRLGPLLDALQKLERGIKTGAVEKASRDRLWGAIQGCEAQVKQLTDIIEKCVPDPKASRVQRTMKALGSLRYDKRIEKIDGELGKYIQALTLHTAASGANDAATAQRTAPIPTSTVPFRPDLYYVDRPHLMTQVAQKMREPAARVALVGIGGVGKSQLAIQYAHDLRTTHPETWVFWISADTTANFEKGFGHIAEKADIPAYSERNANRLHVVKSWLEDAANGPWLIVIDNADDLDVLVPGPLSVGPSKKTRSKDAPLKDRPTQNLLDLLPQTTNGSYLVTSRQRDVAYEITGDYKALIAVSEFSEPEAIDLLTKRLATAPSNGDARRLVTELDCMPLAISHAAAYINRSAPRMNVAKYMDELRKGDSDRANLLESDIYDARRDRSRSNSVIKTWHISFELVRAMRPTAARLLALMSLFNRNDIPEDLLRGRYVQDVVSKGGWWKRLPSHVHGPRGRRASEAESDDDFEGDWATLHSFSLICTALSGDSFSMHALVQFSTKRWLALHARLPVWHRNFIHLLSSTYPVVGTVPLKTSAALLPHAQAALDCPPPDKDRATVLAWAHLCFKLGSYAWDRAAVVYALQAFELSTHIYMALLGRKNPQTIRSAALSARVLIFADRPAEAEEVLQRTWPLAAKAFGSTAEETIHIVADLKASLNAQGKYSDEEAVYEAFLHVCERAPGGLQSDAALWVMGSHGDELVRRGRYEEAEALRRRAFALRQKAGATDPRQAPKQKPEQLDEAYAHEMGHMSMNLFVGGKYAESERLNRDMLAYCTRTQGASGDLDITAKFARYLGWCLNHRELYDEAEPLFRRTVAYYASKGELGREWCDSHADLAIVLIKLKKLEEGEEIARNMLSGHEKVYGEDHWETAPAFHILGTVLFEMKRFEEALPLFAKAYEIGLARLGEENTDTQDYLRDYRRAKDEALKAAAKPSKDRES